jgi:FkbM family methyltransferase
VNYLSYVLHKGYADAAARLWPMHSLAARRTIVRERPLSIDEKVRLIETLSRLGLETTKEYADLVPALTQSFFRHLPEHRQMDSELAAFMGHVLQWLADPATVSSAQIFQDYWALFECGAKRNGYFVEFGAADGLELSNTLLLEQRFGWSGILAEPNPKTVAALRSNRTCAISDACVWSESGRRLDFVQDGYLSTAAAFESPQNRRGPVTRVLVETVSLVDLLVSFEAPRDIDFLSIDTEGSEFEILSRFDFDRFNVFCIAVEHNYSPSRQDLFDLLSSNGYRRRFEAISRWDDWYVRNDGR